MGWVRVRVEQDIANPTGPNISASSCLTILDYAYNNVADEPILAGQKPPAQIPTMSEWGLINLAILLMTFGTIYLINPNFSLRRKREELEG